ncbi:hypothetical protein AB4K20DRAFT_1907611 [Rhizopus microsporus]
MKDTLKDIVDRYTSLRNDVTIIGYNTQGECYITIKIYLDNKLTFIKMGTSAEYVTRIRRLQILPYPTSNDEYIARMLGLLSIALMVLKL